MYPGGKLPYYARTSELPDRDSRSHDFNRYVITGCLVEASLVLHESLS